MSQIALSISLVMPQIALSVILVMPNIAVSIGFVMPIIALSIICVMPTIALRINFRDAPDSAIMRPLDGSTRRMCLYTRYFGNITT